MKPYSSCSLFSLSLQLIGCMFLLITPTKFVRTDSCMQNETGGLGWTYPKGDIILLKGEPLELYCNINLEAAKAENFTVNDLVFRRNNETIDSRYITRINETTIRLNVENKEESDHMYFCYMIANKTSDTSVLSNMNSLEERTVNSPSTSLVCMNAVAVGSGPKEVENITCLAYNLESFTCKWDVPKNFITTNYTIKYNPNHRSQRGEAYACPNNTDVMNSSCTWSLFTKPVYRKSHEFLKVIITGVNKFNTTEQSITINQYAHFLPKGPKDLKLLNKTSTSILLQWNIGDLQYFPKSFKYKILYTHNSTNWSTLMCESKDVQKNKDKIEYNVTNLIPNTMYNFRVFMRSSLATSDAYWSNNYAKEVFRTKAGPPARSPETDVGSFQIEDGSNQSFRTVYVYWKSLHRTEYFADNFRYDIKAFKIEENGTKILDNNAKNLSLNFSFAKYEIGQSAYLFEIRSVNVEGAAPNASFVTIPAAFNLVESCGSFLKTDYGNKSYEVSWTPPANNWPIVNYTIFWCETEKERPYQCDGLINWTHLPADVAAHNFSVNSSESYQFAISANTLQSSSGMLWATCTVLDGRLGFIKNLYVSQVGPTFITVAWKLDCWDRSSQIIGFRVAYCPVSARNESKCLDEERHETWDGGVLRTNGTLTHLKPFTYYKVVIRMFTAKLEGPPSTSPPFRTSDGAPDVDGLRIWVTERTNVSAVVHWQWPSVMNGVLQEFKVLYQRLRADTAPQTVSAKKASTATLSGLACYAEYNVTVVACTSVCSKPMPSIVFRTRIGVPDAPTIDTSSELKSLDGGEVSWSRPANPAGPHPMYDFIVQKDDEIVRRENVTNATHVSVRLAECTNDKGAGFYKLRVRAINVDDQADDDGGGGGGDGGALVASAPLQHVGPWSSVYAVNCNPAALGTTWKVLACIFFPMFLAVVFVVGGRRSIYKCRQMKKVSVTIPMKFALSESTLPADLRGHDLFESYSTVLPFRVADEFSNLVERTTDQHV